MNSRFLLTLTCAAALAVAVPTTANARHDDAARNMILGGIAGAVIGEHNDHRAAEGAAIGAAAGLLLTALTDGHCDRPVAYHAAPPCPPRVVVVPSAHRSHRTVVVVRPAHRPAPRAIVVHSRAHDRHELRHERRHDRRDARHDRREARHDRREERRDNRR